MFLSILIESDYLFVGTLIKWDTTTVDLEVKPGSKPFNARYYLVPNINKENFRNEIKCLIEIGV